MSLTKNVQVWANKDGVPSISNFFIEVNTGEFPHLLVSNYMIKEWGIHPNNFTQVKIDHKQQ